MFVKRAISTTITIDDFQTLRSKNIDNVIFNLVKNKFENICYMKCFIIEVLRLINIGDIESNQNDVVNCSFNVNVLFEVYCEYYQTMEPILDMKILNIRQNAITLGSSNKIAVLKPANGENVGELIKGFEKGDYFPVRAGRCIYEPVSDKIKIGCVSFNTPLNETINIKQSDYKISKDFVLSGDIERVLHEIPVSDIVNLSKLNNSHLLQGLKDRFSKDMKSDYIIISIDQVKDGDWKYKIVGNKNVNSAIDMNYKSLFEIVSDMYIIKKQVKDFKNKELYSEAKLKIINNE